MEEESAQESVVQVLGTEPTVVEKISDAFAIYGMQVLALQGSLSNFASGVLLILFKPFVAGNFVEIGGQLGSVVQVGLLHAELKSPQNIKISIPFPQRDVHLLQENS